MNAFLETKVGHTCNLLFRVSGNQHVTMTPLMRHMKECTVHGGEYGNIFK